ncbi:hypothetical protein LGM65_19970 [Burkholderia anthina]|uniref:hypothetical protein n=1 Tax=Burkholderia anthina TaxID=179879 RepID=UPI001CF1ECCD|nr:hypothetical protein [Burkholderia anthina]MCA8093136.1 hypothetical protein [Burkholderia anthina]
MFQVKRVHTCLLFIVLGLCEYSADWIALHLLRNMHAKRSRDETGTVRPTARGRRGARAMNGCTDSEHRAGTPARQVFGFSTVPMHSGASRVTPDAWHVACVLTPYSHASATRRPTP